MKKNVIISLFGSLSLSAEYESPKAIELLQDVADMQLASLEAYSHDLSGEYAAKALEKVFDVSDTVFEKICSRVAKIASKLTPEEKLSIRGKWAKIALTPENSPQVRLLHKNRLQRTFLGLNSIEFCDAGLTCTLGAVKKFYQTLTDILKDAQNRDAALIIIQEIVRKDALRENYTIFNEFEHMTVEFDIPQEVLMDAFLHDTSGKVLAWFIMNSYMLKEELASFHL